MSLDVLNSGLFGKYYDWLRTGMRIKTYLPSSAIYLHIFVAGYLIGCFNLETQAQ